MNLIIDVGNTRIKIAVFQNSKLIHNEIIRDENFGLEVFKVIKKYDCNNAIIASVGSIKKFQIEEIKDKINLIELDFNTKVPFKNGYATPKTLGVDRIALVASAVTNYKNKNVLIIDVGSCITYDFVNFEAYYFGGSISPGIQLRYKALHEFTEKLPLLKANVEYNDLYGSSTEECIHLGVQNGVVNEIDGVIDQYRKKNKDLTVVLTGGDDNFLANRLKNGIFANPNFLIEGLNTILTYNL